MPTKKPSLLTRFVTLWVSVSIAFVGIPARDAFAIAPVIPIALAVGNGASASAAFNASVTGLVTLAGAAIGWLALRDTRDNSQLRVPLSTAPAAAPPAPAAPATAGTITLYQVASGGASAASPSQACQNYLDIAYAACPAGTTYAVQNGTTTTQCRWDVRYCSNGSLAGSGITSGISTVVGCSAGYTNVAGVCTLSNARAAVPDDSKDWQRSGSTLVPPVTTDADNSKQIAGVANAGNASMQMAGVNSDGNPVVITIAPLPDGGSKIILSEQKTDPLTKATFVDQVALNVSPQNVAASNPSVVRLSSSLAVNPDTQAATLVANPTAAVLPDGSASPQTATTPESLQLPTDYARENTVARSASALEGIRTDAAETLTNPSTVTTDPLTEPHAALETAMQNAGTVPVHGWTWTPFIPTAVCAPWHISMGSFYQTDIDPCPAAEKVRALGGFTLYVLTAFMLFNILFWRREES